MRDEDCRSVKSIGREIGFGPDLWTVMASDTESWGTLCLQPNDGTCISNTGSLKGDLNLVGQASSEARSRSSNAAINTDVLRFRIRIERSHHQGQN
jgi:hypothetical protein